MFIWWKMRQFEKKVAKLNVGATRDQIRAVLGEPARKTFCQDEQDFDEIWDFAGPRRGYQFSIALKNGIYSHAWWGWSLEREQTAQTKP